MAKGRHPCGPWSPARRDTPIVPATRREIISVHHKLITSAVCRDCLAGKTWKDTPPRDPAPGPDATPPTLSPPTLSPYRLEPPTPRAPTHHRQSTAPGRRLRGPGP